MKNFADDLLDPSHDEHPITPPSTHPEQGKSKPVRETKDAKTNPRKGKLSNELHRDDNELNKPLPSENESGTNTPTEEPW
jgi:hypothetical protein